MSIFTRALNVPPFADLETMPPSSLVSIAIKAALRGYDYDFQRTPESIARAEWYRDVASSAAVAIELRMEAAGA